MNMESNLEMSRVVYKRGEIQQLNSRVRAKGLISVLVGFVIKLNKRVVGVLGVNPCTSL